MVGNKQRIIGYDIARALAVFIMVIVNFNMVLAKTGSNGLLSHILNLLQGKGAALFVVLAGAGISLMIKTNLLNKDRIKLRQKRNVLYKRALFLFVFGLIYMPLWPADILHYYGFYISICAFLMTKRSISLWVVIALLIVLYPFILGFVDYETGWDWSINEYTGFWSFDGFFRNLLVNGFHPVIPWAAFALAGVWLGRQNVNDKKRSDLILWSSIGTFVIIQLVSYKLIGTYTLLGIPYNDAVAIFGTKPMPPMPLFMVSGISWSFMVTILCIRGSEKIIDKKVLSPLVKTGQMAFTHYMLHVIVGILSAYLIFGENNLSPLATFLYAISFCTVLVVFSNHWLKKYTRGPVSHFMRIITG